MSASDEVMCEWTLKDFDPTDAARYVPEGRWYTSCGDMVVSWAQETHCKSCGLRVKEIIETDDDEAERDNYSHGPLS